MRRLTACSARPPPRPRSTLFPYTTLFRSALEPRARVDGAGRLLPRALSGAGQAPAARVDRRPGANLFADGRRPGPDRQSPRLNSSHVKISYAVFCLQKTDHERLDPELHDS